MNGIWETLEGLGYIACSLWLIAFAVGLIRPQVMRQADRAGVIRVCSIGFVLSFVVMAVAWSKARGLA